MFPYIQILITIDYFIVPSKRILPHNCPDPSPSLLPLFPTFISHLFISLNYQSTIMLKAVLFSAVLSLILACNIIENTKELVDQVPTLLQTVPNGQKMLIGNPSNPQGDYLYIANLKGTPHEMGKALGQMFAQQIHQTLDLFYAYYMGQLQEILGKKLPVFLSKKITGGVESLLKKILDLNIRITRRYTNSRYYEEIKGIADGAAGKVNARDIERLNLFPELIKAACTVAGVWKEASENGQTLHVRALDWDFKNPISKFPMAIIYHPSDPKLHVHANFGWAGFIGSMTGISDRVSVGEKVWLPPKGTIKMTRYGNPWTYVFRDVLYEANDIKSALDILTKTHRTCAIHIGLASSADHSFRMFEYAQTTLNNYNDSNYTHYGANHPKRSGLAYFDKHVQPSGDSCVGNVLTNKDMYGKWTAEKLYRILGFSHQTGDTQLAVFDLENLQAYISYSSSDGKIKAFERSPIKVDLAQLFKSF